VAAALCLGIHARYQCQHSGACCQTWAVPVEAQVVEIVKARKLRRSGYAGTLFLPDPAHHGGITAARDERNDCVFLDRAAGGLCVIHREAGIEALPAACRHFPRKILCDPRGVLISLSHYCPTAARMLTADGDLTVVEARPPLELPPPLDALDATEALPPLIRPGLLCDMDGYQAWEEAGVATFARDDLTFTECIDLIAAATEIVRRWRPGTESLASRVATAFRTANLRDAADDGAQRRTIARVAALTAGRAADIAPNDEFEDQWAARAADRIGSVDRVMKNYLAARLFANWIAYQGRGLRSIVEWLRTCGAVVRHALLDRLVCSGSMPVEADCVESVRTADLLLLHVLDTAAFARHVAIMEGPESR
jgi:Fe-S-cluster containining protein